MKFGLRTILVALLALCWSDLAAATPPGDPAAGTTIELAAVARVELDEAFERFATRETAHPLHGPAGPTDMTCRNGVPVGHPETCTVTIARPPISPSLTLDQGQADPGIFAIHEPASDPMRR